jgi:predicted dehydrogenase
VAAPIRVGVVGANWGLSHVAAWRSVPGAEVAAICTAHRETAEAVAREHAIPHAYWDAGAMLADPALDVIDVTPRPSIRAPIALRVLAARKHLLQPIPFALDLAQAAELERAAAAANVVANVEVLHRHAPAFLAAKALIDDGFLGEPYAVRGVVQTGILIDRPPDYVYSWITEPDSGASAVRNFGAHLLHVLTWMFGDVVEIAATISTREHTLAFTDGSTKPNGTADTAFALLLFAGGLTGSLHTTWSTPAADGFSIEASGSRGRLVIRAGRLGPNDAVLLTAGRSDLHLREVEIPERFSALTGTLTDVSAGPRGYPLAAMCYRMAEAIRTGDRSQAGPDFVQAHRVMRVVETAYRASESHTWLNVP